MILQGLLFNKIFEQRINGREFSALFDQSYGIVDGKEVTENNHFGGFPILQSARQLILTPLC